ncbi:MAG TPA: hypothetical protein PLC38_01585 [Methanobacterium sp.]|nr:MAG: hypothetical protein FGO69_04655 [Methanobacterium sp.]HOI39815.1 hypothetical protein [Methanobacterium sp.]HOI70957.1 hypothetical protein [Methanobacterium sp.]
MFNKSLIIIVIILFAVIVSISGCTTKNATNGTFGEKTISLNKLEIIDSNAEHIDYEDRTYYYIEGNITNKNDIDALDLKMEATAFDENGMVVDINKNPYLDPKVVPSLGVSYFYFEFYDPDKRIVRYEIKVISAEDRYY